MPATNAMTLDLRGLTVALPVARTAVAMAGLGSGEVPADTGSFFRNGDAMPYITEIPLMTTEEAPP